MNRLCAGCGQKVAGGVAMGGVIVCRQCEPDVSAEMERLRAEGKPVNVAHIARRLFRAGAETVEYLLRDIPDDLWRAVKVRAAQDGMSQRDVLLTALRAYLSA